MPCVAWSMASPTSGGMLMLARSSFSRASPLVMSWITDWMAGRKARTMITSVARMTTMAPTKTAAAALIRDQPRSRRASTNGANVAATMAATRIDAVTVDSRMAIQRRTRPSAIVASNRQPMAASRSSQPGTSPSPSGFDGAKSVMSPQRSW